MKQLIIPDKMSRTINKFGLQIKKHSPEILVVTGVVGTVVGAAMACKATTKLEEVMKKTKDDLEAVKEMKKIKRKQYTLVKEITNKIESNLNLEHKAIIGFTEPENKEIIGLIANKFTGKYRKPTILLREMNSTTWTGSHRSPID